jgi:hypothetical protein
MQGPTLITFLYVGGWKNLGYGRSSARRNAVVTPKRRPYRRWGFSVQAGAGKVGTLWILGMLRYPDGCHQQPTAFWFLWVGMGGWTMSIFSPNFHLRVLYHGDRRIGQVGGYVHNFLIHRVVDGRGGRSRDGDAGGEIGGGRWSTDHRVDGYCHLGEDDSGA